MDTRETLKTMALVTTLAALGAPAAAQIDLGGALKKAQEHKQAVDELTISEADERKIGDDVSARIRARFGVVQNAAVHKYVALVGTTLARASERPNLAWTFIVLDTDGVNAFASPGGLVHITRGALGLIRSEAELAGVLGHEIGHVTRKHTINAIRKNKAVQLGTKDALSNKAPLLDQLANRAYEMVLENNFNRGDELDADKASVELTQKVGYAPGALGSFLARLDDRNKDQPARNGLFASHPETKERINKIKQLSSSSTGVAVEARYTSNISYKPTPITSIAAVADGSAGLTGSSKASGSPGSPGNPGNPGNNDKNKKNGAPAEESKKKGFGFGKLKQAVAPEKESTQVSASGGARGLGPDRSAKGGGNPTLVKTSVSAAELATFKRGIA